MFICLLVKTISLNKLLTETQDQFLFKPYNTAVKFCPTSSNRYIFKLNEFMKYRYIKICELLDSYL